MPAVYSRLSMHCFLQFPDILGPVLESITAIVQRAQTYLKDLTGLPEDLRPEEEGRIYSLLQV